MSTGLDGPESEGTVGPASSAELAPALRERLISISRKLGRAPRVLCISNIANNAFYTARLLRNAGIECDVIAYDYYHIMGCPEWEEADFENLIEDQFQPAWRDLDLGSYSRPRWFVQGPLETCLAYLRAVNEGRTSLAERVQRKLSILNRTRRHAFADSLDAYFELAVYQFRRVRNLSAFPARLASRLAHEQVRLRDSTHLAERALAVALTVFGPVWLTLARGLAHLENMREKPVTGDEEARRIAQLCAKFSASFPSRPDPLTESDLQPYTYWLGAWRDVMRHYDIIQGFATDPIWPLLAGRKYFALEHGTLRDLPFAQTSQGRITALGYHFAEHVFVTNADCMDNARYLAGERVTAINHPYDEDANYPVTGWESTRKRLHAELDAEFLMFHPTRHDWVPGTGYADKANDVFIRALAELRARGLRVGAVCCAWGRNVGQSKTLLQDLGVTRHVHWCQPLAHVRFLRMAQACGIVVDQFKLGGFGGITFKTLAAGIPVCTNLDVEATVRSFGEAPPVLKAGDPVELVAAIAGLYRDPARLAQLAQASREWIKRHHGGAQLVNVLVGNYCDLLESTATSEAA